MSVSVVRELGCRARWHCSRAVQADSAGDRRRAVSFPWRSARVQIRTGFRTCDYSSIVRALFSQRPAAMTALFLPPPEFDRPYQGSLDVIRAGTELITHVCGEPHVGFKMTGCALRYA